MGVFHRDKILLRIVRVRSKSEAVHIMDNGSANSGSGSVRLLSLVVNKFALIRGTNVVIDH